MLDSILDELQAVLSELGATLMELDTVLAGAYDAFRKKLGQWLYRLGYRLQGEEYEAESRE